MSEPVANTPSILTLLPVRLASIVERLAEAWSADGEELALVGGIVRNALIGDHLHFDLDFATSTLPERSLELGQRAGASSAYLMGASFGTIGLVFQNEGEPVNVEITTYRSEQYPDDTRKPDVSFGTSLSDDLSRRDFTINAIAADTTTGTIVDPHYGRADLDAGLIRSVGNPADRFEEDPLRLLRAARFVSQLGFAVEPATLAAMTDQAESLQRISSERILSELTRLLTGPYAAHGLETLLESGLLTIAMPELALLANEATRKSEPHIEKDLWVHTKRVVDKSPSDPVVRWAAFLHDAAKPQTRRRSPDGELHFFGHEQQGAVLANRLLGRLHASKAMQTSVSRIVELHGRPESYEHGWSDSAVRRLMLDAGSDLEPLLQLAAADVTSSREERQREAEGRVGGLRQRIAILEEQHALESLTSPLDGNELMQSFNRPPGRWIAEIKNHLTELVVEGELEPDDKVAALAIAREMLDDTQS